MEAWEGDTLFYVEWDAQHFQRHKDWKELGLWDIGKCILTQREYSDNSKVFLCGLNIYQNFSLAWTVQTEEGWMNSEQYQF